METTNTRRGFTQIIVRGNLLFTSPLEGEDVQRTDEGVLKRKALFYTPSPRCWRTRPLPPGARETAHGFTLIELLVVVLIIGILAAVAVPQYQKAVVKARFAEAFANLKTIGQAFRICELENNPDSSSDHCNLFDNLSISLPNVDEYGGTAYSQYFQYKAGSVDTSDTVIANANYTETGSDTGGPGVCVCLLRDGRFVGVPGNCSDEPTWDILRAVGIDPAEEEDNCNCC